MMEFAGKKRFDETKYKKISEDLKKDTNSFVETISSIFEGSTTIKNNLEEKIKDKEADKRLAEFVKDPATALLKMVYTGIDSGKKELITELTNIKTEEEALKFLKNNDSFNDAVNLSNSFHELLEDMNKAQKLAEKQGKKMAAEFATTYWERIKGRIGPHIGRAESSDISQKRATTINSIIDEISSNPEVLQNVGKAYFLVSTLGKLNRNARERAEGGKLKNELEPVLNTVKEYISNYDSNTQKIKDEIGAKVPSGSSKENRQSAEPSSTASTTTKGTYYGWKSKSAMNEWLNDLDHYLKVNPKQKELAGSEYKKYEEEITSHKLTMDHALQLYTAVVSAKAEVLKSERNEETHFNHATKHLVNMFNKETDIEKKKELADMIYRVDLAYTASISRWETSELKSNDKLITMFSQTNLYLRSLYPDANAQPEYEELRKELQKLAEHHARGMYNLLKGKTLQVPTDASDVGSLLRKPQ